MATGQLLAHGISLGLSVLAMVIVQLFSVRIGSGRFGVISSLFLGLAIGLAVLLVGEVMCLQQSKGKTLDDLGLTISNLILFLCGWYFYFHFINIGEASLRIRVLREASRFPGQPVERLLAVYNVRTIVETRMARLVQDGQLVVQGDVFLPGKPRMVVVAKIFSLIRWLLLGRTFATGSPEAKLR